MLQFQRNLPERSNQLVVVHRFQHIAAGVHGHRLFQIVKILVPADENDAHFRIVFQRFLRQLEPGHIRHPDIGDENVHMFPFQHARRRESVVDRRHHFHIEIFPRNERAKPFQIYNFIIGKQHFVQVDTPSQV